MKNPPFNSLVRGLLRVAKLCVDKCNAYTSTVYHCNLCTTIIFQSHTWVRVVMMVRWGYLGGSCGSSIHDHSLQLNGKLRIKKRKEREEEREGEMEGERGRREWRRGNKLRQERVRLDKKGEEREDLGYHSVGVVHTQTVQAFTSWNYVWSEKSFRHKYSKTSLQGRHWGWAICPLYRGCPLLRGFLFNLFENP